MLDGNTAPPPADAVAVPGSMRGVVLTGHGGVDKLVYREDLPTPEPAQGEVLVAVGACGVNNTDVNTRTAWYDRAVTTELSEESSNAGREDDETNGGDGASAARRGSWNASALDFPRINGAAIAGRIVRVGQGVDPARVGERVLVDPQIRDGRLPARSQLAEYIGSERDGGFAEYAAVPAENAHGLECDLSDAELATFPCSYDTAEEMLDRSQLRAGECLVITGAAGGVGTALIQLAQIRGATVVAIASETKENRVRALGATHFVAREGDNVVAAVAQLVGNQGVDVVTDVVGGPAFSGLLKMLRRGGRYCTAGAIAGPVASIDLRDLIYKDLEMYGITSPTVATFRRIVDLVADGKLKPLLEAAYPLPELARAQNEFVKRNHVGKLVIVP